nr:uncharacterized protein CI109_002731 [Kwoniella shandongensis]KAA5528974.1 hypothetical protein CI109_002731 [Kwoniella shandongensis]
MISSRPACFDRPPAKADSFFRYDPFEAFSLPAKNLNHPHQLVLPPELVSHGVGNDDWFKFITDLSRESLHSTRTSLIHRHLHHHRDSSSVLGDTGYGPEPILSDAVHSLLASWAVAFFAPRGIRVYAAQDGKKVIPPPVEPMTTKRGFSHAEEWSDDESDYDDDDDSLYRSHTRRRGRGGGGGRGSRPSHGSIWSGYTSEEEERQARHSDLHLPRLEREYRASERDRIRRREKRRRYREAEVRRGERAGDWEIHFVCATPTIWTPGARPRTYGEPVIRLRR